MISHSGAVHLALVTTSKKLRLYFKLHKIIVLIDKLIGKILNKPKISSRLIKYSVELGQHHIVYQLRSSIKEQVLINFVAEITTTNDEVVEEDTAGLPL